MDVDGRGGCVAVSGSKAGEREGGEKDDEGSGIFRLRAGRLIIHRQRAPCAHLCYAPGLVGSVPEGR